VRYDGRPLLSSYGGTVPDHRGRFLREIQNWSDEDLERTHDYIQWLFPLAEPSGFNIDAPILDDGTVSQFRANADLRRRLQTSLIRMLSFYGLEIHGTVPLTVTRAPNSGERIENWLTPSNHNHLRITRILESLKLLGLGEQARAFFDCLADIYRVESVKATPRISEETFTFWQAAAHG
jgi:hypothetical protein